jgi:hypothetical protein
MLISWIYATLNSYLLDLRKHFQTIAVIRSPVAGTRPVFLKPIASKLRIWNPAGGQPSQGSQRRDDVSGPAGFKSTPEWKGNRLVASCGLPF